MHEGIKTHRSAQAAGPQAAVTPAPHRVRSGDLLRGQRRLVIEHGEASYTLLLTRNGKLILTK